MKRYVVTETIEWEVQAESEEDAIDKVIHGESEDVAFRAVTDRTADLEAST